MGILLSTVRTTLNLLLPFTHPGTPLTQDLIHTAILVITLYYAPQIAEEYNKGYGTPIYPTQQTHNQHAGPAPDTAEDIPLDDRLVLQPDTDNEEVVDAEPPPHAPTPPPGQARAQGGQAQVPPPEGAAWQAGNNGDAGAGPADRPQATRANRVIGAKKAKSLARRDQRRAYHEFHRSQAEQRRQAEEEGREERESALAAEKARRAEVEREIAERERAERALKREEEKREQEEEMRRRERVVERVREEVGMRGAVDLVGVAMEEGKDVVWVERLVRASGMAAQMEKKDEKVLITGEGWLVKIDAELMHKAYAEAASFGDSRDGRISIAEFGSILEKAVRARGSAMA